MRFRRVEGRFGPLVVAGDDDSLQWVAFLHGRQVLPPPRRAEDDGFIEDEASTLLREAERQLHEYFTGARQSFDLPLAPRGTPFQKRVWHELIRIPFGETKSYGELARQMGRPTSFRAVGAANGQNPISIIIPCHRLVGKNGSLTGYGGGLDTKRDLLEHERKMKVLRAARSA